MKGEQVPQPRNLVKLRTDNRHQPQLRAPPAARTHLPEPYRPLGAPPQVRPELGEHAHGRRHPRKQPRPRRPLGNPGRGNAPQRLGIAKACRAAEAPGVLLGQGQGQEGPSAHHVPIRPAADIPRVAKEAGAQVIEINPEHTDLTDWLADLIIQEQAGIAIPQIIAAIKAIAS